MLSDIRNDAQKKISQIIDTFQKDIAVIRAGRATPSLVEDIQVDAYETKLMVKELGTIGVPEAGLLTISPWDSTVLNNIAAAIRKSDLGVDPVVDGEIIKLTVPHLSEERRQEMVKRVSKLAEEARIKIRQIRQDKIKSSESFEDSGGISEDELFRFREELQTMVEKHNQQIEQLCQKKEEELAQ
ncbi:ribosome recycling factor [Patescibacteria group bacterium]|nr:ribosome recycling factor [Patescibacteria group bacterium]MBU1868520.1 ribosome recycling factor [Patescibacteria group bacterium]